MGIGMWIRMWIGMRIRIGCEGADYRVVVRISLGYGRAHLQCLEKHHAEATLNAWLKGGRLSETTPATE